MVVVVDKHKPDGAVAFVLLVFLHLASGEASISVQDSASSFSTVCKPLTSVDGLGRFVDEQVVPGFANDSAFSQPSSFELESFNDGDKVSKSPEDVPLIDNDFDGTNAVSLVIVFVGMALLMTNTHFSRPVCAVVSLGFWIAVLWIGVMLSLEVGVGVSLVAVWMRSSWLLFPKGAVRTLQCKDSADAAGIVSALEEYFGVKKGQDQLLQEFGDYLKTLFRFGPTTAGKIRLWQVETIDTRVFSYFDDKKGGAEVCDAVRKMFLLKEADEHPETAMEVDSAPRGVKRPAPGGMDPSGHPAKVLNSTIHIVFPSVISQEIQTAFDNYTRVGQVLRKDRVPLQESIDRLLADVSIPKPFILLDGPSGVGKSQQIFALDKCRVVYLVLSSWAYGPAENQQKVYSAFQPLSTAFKECVSRDATFMRSVMTADDKNIVSTSILDPQMNTPLYTAGFILTVLKMVNSVDRTEALKNQMIGFDDFKVDPASMNNVRAYMKTLRTDDGTVFALDELPPSVDAGLLQNTFCRNIFRKCGLVVVLAGTDSTIKNAFVGSEATRTEEDPILLAELQLTMAPTTLDSIRASSNLLSDFEPSAEILALMKSSRPLLAVKVALAVHTKRLTTLDDIADSVARSLHAQKPKLREDLGLLGQWLMFSPSMLSSINKSKKSKRALVVGGIISHHMADLDATLSDGSPAQEILHFYVKDSAVSLGADNGPWRVCSRFRGPANEPLLYLALSGTKSQAVFQYQSNAIPTTRALNLIDNLHISQIMGTRPFNPNAPSNDGNQLEEVLATIFSTASHCGGVAGTTIDRFGTAVLAHSCADDVFTERTIEPPLSTLVPSRDKDLKIPYLFPAELRGSAQEAGVWTVPEGLKFDDCCFGQVDRPANGVMYDVQMLVPAAAQGVMKCAGEAKDYDNHLDSTTITKCLVRIPDDVGIHLIACNTVREPYKRSGLDDTYTNTKTGKSRHVQLYIARRSDDKIRLDRVHNTPSKKEHQDWVVVVILPIVDLAEGYCPKATPK